MIIIYFPVLPQSRSPGRPKAVAAAEVIVEIEDEGEDEVEDVSLNRTYCSLIHH